MIVVQPFYTCITTYDISYDIDKTDENCKLTFYLISYTAGHEGTLESLFGHELERAEEYMPSRSTQPEPWIDGLN